MKELIGGSKKAGQQPTAIKDPVTNELIVSNDEIKKVILKYCVDTLQNNVPDVVVQNLINITKVLHEARMNEKVDCEMEIDEVDFEKVLRRFKNNRFIHMKDYLPRLYEALVVSKMIS